MATDVREKIIDVFLQKNSIEISDRDLRENFDLPNDFIWTIQTLGSSLFQVDFQSKNSFVVRLKPKISLCEDFLVGRCKTKVTSCSKLHACRYLGQCRRSSCRWPHDFNDERNRKLLSQFQCENLRPVSLFRLLKLKQQKSTNEMSFVENSQIELPHRFAMIVDHPVFGRDFRNFIRSELHVDIELDENRLGIADDFYVTKETMSLLHDRTRKFMKSFAFRTIQMKKPREQLKILEENASIVAFHRFGANRCLLAARSMNIGSLMQKIMSTDSRQNQTFSLSTKTILTSLYLQSPSQIALFSDQIIEKRFCDFIQRIHRVEMTVDSTTNSNHRLVKMTGVQSAVERAKDDFDRLLSLCRTKIYKNLLKYPWIKIQDSVYVIQHFLHLENIVCLCEYQTNPFSVQIHFVDENHSEFGIDEEKLDDWCSKRLTFTEITLQNPSNDQWTKVMNEIRGRSDYRQTISLIYKNASICIFGTFELIEFYQKSFEQLKQNEIDRLLEQKKRLATPILKKFVPKYSLNFIIDRPGFDRLILKEPSCLTSIIPSNCSLEKEIVSATVFIEIPLSHVETENLDEETTITEPSIDNRPFWQRIFGFQNPTTTSQPSSSVLSSSSLNVGRSKILISQGDLRTQKVDAIVVASTSKYLCEAIAKTAGDSIWNSYQINSNAKSNSWECDGGDLPCKKIIFRPWTEEKLDSVQLEESIEGFVSSAIDFAREENFTTIAFPSVGCGQLAFDPKIIAQSMIGQTYRKVKTISLKVTFVIEPSKTNVYDAFIQQLKVHPPVDIQPEIFSYKKQMLKISLTGPDRTLLTQIQQQIEILARSCSSEVHLTDKIDLIDWSQETIKTFFVFCLQKNVVPTMNIDDGTLDLLGPKEAISEAEKYFYQLIAETLRQTQKRPEKWMDPSFPSNWDLTGPYFQRVKLSSSSTEYKNVLTKFDMTMKNLCQKIVSIERIQNRRWFKQYAAHREDYQQRDGQPNEKNLFHGCPKSSADRIVKECFNRAFAGVNGVVYGCGVYFHSQAQYSHQYTRAESSGERTMFLSKVLIGRTTLGNSTMKTPPDGFDTTTDSKDIFVVYHDAGAYAEYLITYI